MRTQELLNLRFETRLTFFMVLHRNDIDGLKSLLVEELPKTQCNYGKLLHKAASWNSEIATRHLIDLGTEVDYLGEDGKTPLMEAITRHGAASIKVLLDSNASIDVVDARGENALHTILRTSDALPYLGTTTQFEVFQAFFQGMKNRISTVEEFARKLIDAEFSLYHTAFSCDIELLDYMLSRGFHVNSRSPRGSTALHSAAAVGDLRLAKWLVERGADVDALDVQGRSPLFAAAWNCHTAMLEFLLERGADPNVRDLQIRCTPLFALFAFSRPQTYEIFDDCVEILLQCGAVPQNSTVDPYTMFEHALCNLRSPNGIDCLIAHLAMFETSIAKSVVYFDEEKYRWRMTEFRDQRRKNIEKYYEQCQQMLTLNVFKKLSLLDLLNASDTKMKLLVRNETFVSEVEKFCREHELKVLYSYYFKTLMKRISKATDIVKLEENAILVICKIFNRNYNLCYDFAKQIVGYLNKRELERLCLVSE